MRHTENPLTYAFGRPAVKRVLYWLDTQEGPSPYEEARQSLGIAAQTFHRLTRRLAQLDLAILRAPRGDEFENGRIRVVLEISPRGRRIVDVLHELDSVVTAHAPSLGKRVVADLDVKV